MRCPRCQHENREGARFCEACGGPLTQTCPACGHRPRPGAPIAHEDHAVWACHAALAMQTSVKHYAGEVQQTRGVPIHNRVGLNSREVVVRAIGGDLHMGYTAVGETTHLAARMEQLARTGTTLLNANTRRLVEGYVEVTPLGPMKGRPEPVEVYELRRAGWSQCQPPHPQRCH
jgi:class 3 adenylate cyclase